MKPNLNIEEVVASSCESAMRDGKTQWKAIRAALSDRIQELPSEERVALENALRLMISRDEDQSHKAVKH